MLLSLKVNFRLSCRWYPSRVRSQISSYFSVLLAAPKRSAVSLIFALELRNLDRDLSRAHSFLSTSFDVGLDVLLFRSAPLTYGSSSMYTRTHARTHFPVFHTKLTPRNSFRKILPWMHTRSNVCAFARARHSRARKKYADSHAKSNCFIRLALRTTSIFSVYIRYIIRTFTLTIHVRELSGQWRVS